MVNTIALDKVVERVRTAARMYPNMSLDALVKDARFIMDISFPLALQDPRYLDYCKEQDEKEYWTPSKGMAEYRAKWFIPIDLDFTP